MGKVNKFFLLGQMPEEAWAWACALPAALGVPGGCDLVVWSEFINFAVLTYQKLMTMRPFLFAIVAIVAITAMGQKHTLRATKYHPGMGGAGWVTASGARIDNAKLKNYEIRWVALSHDMFSRHGFRLGDTIEVTCENVEKLNGLWVVKDKMGKHLRKRIDFLLPRHDNYGFSQTTVTIEKKK